MRYDLKDINETIEFNKLPGLAEDQYDYSGDSRMGFLNELKLAGYKPVNQISVGQMMRMDDPTDAKGKNSGWAIYYEMADMNRTGSYIGIGIYGSWKADIKSKWTSKKQKFYTEQERLFYESAIKEAEKIRELEIRKKNEDAKLRAQDMWSKSSDYKAHKYITDKKINAYNVKQQGDALVIPLFENEEIVNLQRIFIDETINKETGEIKTSYKKRFLKGGKKKGCYGIIKGSDDVVYICEGYSTGASIHMATGCNVYIAFDAGNLYSVCTHVKKNHANIIVCGDDDFNNDINIGRNKATDAADALNLKLAFPDGYNDFNDMMIELGVDAVNKALQQETSIQYYSRKESQEYNVIDPVGIMSDLVDHYMFTSGKRQKGFAMQTVLAALSVVLGRDFQTSYENYTSLYFVNIGHSGAGKDHCKKYIERVFEELDCEELICGDGFTSEGAIFTTLEQSPKALSIIDEFGMYMKSVNDVGNSHMRQAISYLMQAITKLGSSIRLKAYSQATVAKSKRQDVSKKVSRPALSLLCLTTPDAFFDSVNHEAVKSGLFNRFIIYVDESPIEERNHRPWIETPDTVKAWHNAIKSRINPDDPITLQFDDDAKDAFKAYGRECIDWANELIKINISEMPMRANEWAMRLSLIAALSENPDAEIVERRHAEFGINYMKTNLDFIVKKVKGKLYTSAFEKDKLAFLSAIRDAGEIGVLKSDMNKKKPFSSIKPKDRKEIIDDLLSGDLVIEEHIKTGKAGQPPIIYRALK
jgi:putative DNA primase/helicase